MESSAYKTVISLKNLKKTLKAEYSFIENITEASFIKSRNPNTAAVLVTFNLQEQPWKIYILGQPSETAVYKYQDWAMIYLICNKYGHTKAGCKWKGVFQICGEDDHMGDKTNKCSNESECTNCGEGHVEGSNECETEKRERVIKKCKLTAELEDEKLFKS